MTAAEYLAEVETRAERAVRDMNRMTMTGITIADIPRLVRMLRVAIVTFASRADYDEQGKPSNADAVALAKLDAIANE
jgi:hypothetical protein